MLEECFGNGPFLFKLNENGSGPQLLNQVFLERGWREFNSEQSDQWNLWWRTSGFPVGHHRNLYSSQFINHIPKGSSICRKDNLVRYLRCMKKIYGSVYNFTPSGYNLPLEYTKLAAECNKDGRISTKNSDYRFFEEKPIWICKPVAQSQGRGIFLFRKLSELNYDSNTIVQRYIEKPLLIGGYKFDLRLYVCIPSYHPVTIYMYREGLARFSTDKFSLNDLRNPFRHLTNSSINKLGPGYAEMKDRVGSGCKWTLKQLRRYFQQAGISDWLLWQRISSLVILTVLSHANQIPATVNCFEFFGFDVLIDESLRPWLLEVNLSPALSNDCDTDRIVKKPMLHDMFDLLGLPMYNTGLSVLDHWLDEDKTDASFEPNGDKLLKSALSVLNAAGKWKRKHRKMSTISPRSVSGNRSSKMRKVLTVAQNLPKAKQINLENSNYKNDVDNTRKTYGSTKWGNGRDWNSATIKEGGWMRIWPQEKNGKKSSNNYMTIKDIVVKVTRFSKVAKELFRMYPNCSECELNELLNRKMGLSGEIWIPPV